MITSWANFSFSGIEKAKRGVPQIEVSFSISPDGILKVGAKDTKTGATGNVVIAKNSGRLSESDIARMLAEAEKFRAQDLARTDKIEAFNEMEQFLSQMPTHKKLDRIKEKSKMWLENARNSGAELTAAQVRARIEAINMEAQLV